MRRAPLGYLSAVLAVAVACSGGGERGGHAAPAGTANAASSSVAAGSDRSPMAPVLAWNDTAAGSVLVVAGSNPTEGAIVFPHFNDSTLGTVTTLSTLPLNGAHADLFARSGPAGQAALTIATPGALTGDCTAWPTAHVRSLDPGSAGVPAGWTVAFLAGHAVSVPMDSLATLPPVDSAKRAAEIALVASTLPGDTAAAFRGLPFVVRSAGRLALDGASAVAAEVVRTVNEEANPREEHILLVSEHDSVTGKPVAAYFERVSGPEDAVESSEILAAVRLGPRRTPTIIIGRDYGDGGAYTLVERVGPLRWRVRWNSAYTGC